MKNRTLIIGGVVGVLALALVWFGLSVHYHNSFNTSEANLQAHYDSNRAKLAQMARQIETEMGVANTGNDKVGQILQAAIEGRYKLDGDGKTSAVPGQQSFFSAIVEAYPSLAENTKLYAQILGDVRDLEQQYFNMQRDLATEAAAFSVQLKNFPASLFAGGYPDQDLHALKYDNGVLTTVHGREALEQMKNLVTSKESNDAYGTGEYNGPNIPGAPTPAPHK
jgi:hypothetical protein